MGDEEGKDELAEIEDKIRRTKLSKEAREKADAGPHTCVCPGIMIGHNDNTLLG